MTDMTAMLSDVWTERSSHFSCLYLLYYCIEMDVQCVLLVRINIYIYIYIYIYKFTHQCTRKIHDCS